MIKRHIQFRLIAVAPVANAPLTKEEFATLLTVEYELAVRQLICPCSGHMGGCGAAKRYLSSAVTKPVALMPGLVGLKKTLEHVSNKEIIGTTPEIKDGLNEFLSKFERYSELSPAHRSKLDECKSVISLDQR
jgi:hypothetical protein